MSAERFAEDEMTLLLLGMVTAGIVGSGGSPGHMTMELLVLNKKRMLELTQKLERMVHPALRSFRELKS